MWFPDDELELEEDVARTNLHSTPISTVAGGGSKAPQGPGIAAVREFTRQSSPVTPVGKQRDDVLVHLLECYVRDSCGIADHKTRDRVFSDLCHAMHSRGVLGSVSFLYRADPSSHVHKCAKTFRNLTADVDMDHCEHRDDAVGGRKDKEFDHVDWRAQAGPACAMERKQSVLLWDADERSDELLSTPSLSQGSQNGHELMRMSNSRYETEFEQVCKIGQGGFGAVYKAVHALDQLPYAIKKIKFKRVQSVKDLPEKLLREVRCLARLEHSNVVRYYGAWMEFEPIQIDDGSGEVGSGTAELSNGGSSNVTPVLNWDDYTDMGEDGGMLDASSFDESAPFYGVSLFIQMQLCELSLNAILERLDRVVDPLGGMHVFVQIVHGLQYIHSQGLIHRDLKPSNVFLSGMEGRDLSTATVTLGDFGVATYIGDEMPSPDQSSPSAQVDAFHHPSAAITFARPDSSPLEIVPPSPMRALSLSGSYTSRTTGIGTTSYASPEQLRLDQYDESTDLYSLGIILFELFHPFRSRMERAHALTELRTSRVIPAEFHTSHPTIANMVLQLVQHNPELRPAATSILNSTMVMEYEEKMGGRSCLHSSPELSSSMQMGRLQKQLEDAKVVIKRQQLVIEKMSRGAADGTGTVLA